MLSKLKKFAHETLCIEKKTVDNSKHTLIVNDNTNLAESFYADYIIGDFPTNKDLIIYKIVWHKSRDAFTQNTHNEGCFGISCNYFCCGCELTEYYCDDAIDEPSQDIHTELPDLSIDKLIDSIVRSVMAS